MSEPLVPQFIKIETVSTKTSSEINERWVQDVIERDPSLLGLGNDLTVVGKERIQRTGGRIDFLMQDDDRDRYVVEVQLGETDESHIIRTIEYWDVERRKYPNVNHTAVIIAEKITSRFFNVIGLFNKAIPMIAIQMEIVKQPGGFGIFFVKVVDTDNLADPDEGEVPPTDRAYWETVRGTKETVRMADELLATIQTFEKDASLTYNKFYIGLRVRGKPCNFVSFRPQKNAMQLAVCLPEEEAITQQLESGGATLLNYDKQWKQYRLKLKQEQMKGLAALLKDVMQRAYSARMKP